MKLLVGAPRQERLLFVLFFLLLNPGGFPVVYFPSICNLFPVDIFVESQGFLTSLILHWTSISYTSIWS